METILLLFVVMITLDLAALRWGHDSRERFDSLEWEKLRTWKAFH